MDRQQAVSYLKNNPVGFARMLGFTKLKKVHNTWIKRMVQDPNDWTLQACRGTYKTTCVSVALALIIILLPKKRTLFMRKTDVDVKEVIKQVQKILQDPHTLYFVQCIYGVNLRLTVASATEVSTNLMTDNKGTSQLVGTGIGSSLTGKHFDYIFTDDIVNINDRVSRSERERTKIVYQELQNIKNRGGKIVNTGTPWHKEDAFSIMPEAEKYNCYNEEIAELFADGELDDIRSKMLRSLFAANYELKFVAAEDVIFENPQTGAEPSLAEQGISHIDAAYGGEDWTAMTIANRHDGKLYIYGRVWQRSIEAVEDECVNLHNAFKSGRLYCEGNADKGFLGKELRKKNVRVTIYNEGMNKFLKITSYLKYVWKDVIFVQGTDSEYIDMICDYNENAEHDDAPDSAACVARIFSKKSETEYTPLWN